MQKYASQAKKTVVLWHWKIQCLSISKYYFPDIFSDVLLWFKDTFLRLQMNKYEKRKRKKKHEKTYYSESKYWRQSRKLQWKLHRNYSGISIRIVCEINTFSLEIYSPPGSANETNKKRININEPENAFSFLLSRYPLGMFQGLPQSPNPSPSLP